MIDINAKIHDSLSLEFKVGFKPKEKNHNRNFTLGMWFFVPNSLDINPSTYSKTDFYRDVKSNVRLVIPPYRLDNIVGGDAEPMHNVLEATDDEYGYQLRVFSAIVKSSLRDSSSMDDCRFSAAVDDIIRVFSTFRESSTHSLCGEFLCNICSQFAFKRIENGGDKKLLTGLILEIDNINKSLKSSSYPNLLNFHSPSPHSYTHPQS